MSKGGKILLWSIVAIVIAGVSIFVALKWDGFVGLIKGERTYTYAEVQEIEEKAYQKGLSKQNEYEIEIKDYKTKIEELSQKINNLTEAGSVDKNTIKELDLQISNLTQQIDDLLEQIENKEADKEKLQAEIDELKLKLQEYQDIAEKLELENKVAVTFVYDGQIYGDSVIVEKGSTIILSQPENTDYVKFNYWYIEGASTPLDEIVTVNENTRIIANLTYYQKVTFVVDGTSMPEFVERGACVSKEDPTLEGYKFLGWYVNNEKINFDNYVITKDITIIAQFVEQHTVTYKYITGGQWATKQVIVDNNEIVTNFSAPNRPGYTNLGFTANGNDIVNLSSYVVTSDVTLTAKYSPLFYNSYSLTFGDDSFYSRLTLQYNSSKDVWTINIKVGSFMSLNGSMPWEVLLDSAEVSIIPANINSSLIVMQGVYDDFSFSFCLENSKTISNSNDASLYTYLDIDGSIFTNLVMDYCKNNEII